MSLQPILEDIKAMESETGRTSVFIYGAPVKLTTNQKKSILNRIGPFEYQALKGCIDDGSNLARLKQNHVDLIVSSPGGRVAFSVGIMRILYAKFGKVNVIVPTMAGSSAALMSFSGSKLYVGANACTSDFWHENESLTPAQLMALITATKTVIQKGDVVDKEHIDLFVLINNMLKMTHGHGPIRYASLMGLCENMGVTLKIQNLSSIDDHDPNFKISHLSQRHIDLDQKIRNYMIKNEFASLVLVSNFFNMATN